MPTKTDAYLAMVQANFARQTAAALERAFEAAQAITEEIRKQNRLLDERKWLRMDEDELDNDIPDVLPRPRTNTGGDNA